MRPGPLTIANLALSLLLAGCHSSPPRAPAIGEAYVGPPTLNLRSDIPTQSSTVTTVKHGDRLAILTQKHSFFRVRAPNGQEGWTDQRQLLSADDMAGLKALAERAASLPPQMRATVDADLRVHIQPASAAPSFLTLKENDKVDVLTHLRRPRTDLPRKPLVTPAPKKARVTKPSKKQAVPPPPMPAAPPPPPNWLDMSKSDESDDPPDEPSAPSGPSDDWSLVRALDGQTGWALTRRLSPAIPDEVAQYAEGHRIVSFFSLGSVQDGDLKKDTWLWTTVGDGIHPYDFDSLRVFSWSVRHHRYETAYVQRKLIGYLPVLLQPVSYSPAKGKNSGQTAGFSVCVQKKDGQLYRQQFAVLEAQVRFAGDEPCQLPPPVDFKDLVSAARSIPAPVPAPPESFSARLKKRFKALTGKWFGH